MLRTSALALLLLCLPLAGNALDLEDCRITAGPGYPGIKARCGTFARPLDPARPDGEQLELKVAVVPALDLTPEPDPLVPLAGGPGGSAIQFYSAYAAAFEPVRRKRDILLIDQRGTGESAHMDCPIDDDIVEGQYSAEETITFTQACLDQLPHDRFRLLPRHLAELDAGIEEALHRGVGHRIRLLLGPGRRGRRGRGARSRERRAAHRRA